MPDAIQFSVIVPARNRPEEIRRCVESLYALDFPPTQYEAIVVDNGSTDETARAAAGAGARVISEPTPSRCLARNAGARVARGRWLAFTDSDCEADRGWLAAMARAVAGVESEPGAERVAVLAGAIEDAPARTTVEAYIAHRRWLDQEKFLEEGRFSPPFAATANLCVRADAFADVGGFDPPMAPAEDADWCWRATARGWRIQYVKEARVTHHHRATLGGMIRQAYGYGLGNAALFAKHRDQFGAKVWIDPRFAGWAMKGLIKTPWCWATGRDPLQRRLAWYDFLSNAAQAWGRVRGGAHKRRLTD